MSTEDATYSLLWAQLSSPRRSLFLSWLQPDPSLSVVPLHGGLLWTTAQPEQGWDVLLGTTSACLCPLPCTPGLFWKVALGQYIPVAPRASAPSKAGKKPNLMPAVSSLAPDLNIMGSRELLESKPTAIISTGCIRPWSNSERCPGLPWWARWLLFRYYDGQFRNPEEEVCLWPWHAMTIAYAVHNHVIVSKWNILLHPSAAPYFIFEVQAFGATNFLCA